MFPALVPAAPSPAAQTADGTASLEQILEDISDYDGGKESEAVWKLRAYVYAAADDPVLRAECEMKLLDFLKTPATPLAKMAVCRHLRIIGSDRAVPVLQAMLSDDALNDMALYALQKIPGAEADKALVQALSAASGPTKTALIAAVGERESALAIPELVSLLERTEFAGSAATALGSIGGAEAERALAKAYPAAQGDHKSAVAAAMLQCAEKAMTAKNTRAAARLYETLSADATLAVSLRKAAVMGRISAAGNRGAAILTDYLKGSDVEMQEAAIAGIRDVIEPDAIGPLCELMPGLPESSQIKLLAVLAGYPKERVLPAIIQTTRHNSSSVRVAAIKALESAGDHSAVPLLAEAAAKTRGPEQTAARRTLGALKGSTVDEAILELLTRNPSEEIREELILAAAERRTFSAKSAIAGFLSSASPGVRIQALRALRILGSPSDIPAVLNLLVETDSLSERTEAEITTAVLARKTADPDNRSNFVKLRLATEKRPEVSARLIGTLPQIGDNSALPFLRQALRNNDADVVDAAVRALSSWPTSVAREDVFKLAEEAQDETHRLLAIRGFVRIIGLEPYRNPEAAVADLRQAAGFARRPEEKKLVLGVLVNFPCKDALNMAEGFLDEPMLKAEAQSAVNRIKQSLSGRPIRGR
ncbi:MAG: HEAT repeat domain-containing protein [Acidobacteria bacterium]|nr:HEAT repeat domain-containing protein [Acidobacteriota bacterium]